MVFNRCAAGALALALGAFAHADILERTVVLDVSTDPNFDPAGLSATATFRLDTDSPSTLQILLINTSTGTPATFDSADQLLTSLSFDLGGLSITGGGAVVGPGGFSLNFSNVGTQLGEGDSLESEWGFGNAGTTGLLANFISTNTAGATAFPGANLDGPAILDGPQGGIATDPPLLDLGGLGAVAPSIVATLSLSGPLSNLDFLDGGAIAEFGSDAGFLTPEPTSLLLCALGSLVIFRRRS